MLAHTPINRNVAATHGGAVVVHLLDKVVRRYHRWNRRDFFCQALPLCQWNGGVSGVGPLFTQERAPVDSIFALEVGQDGVERAFASVQCSTHGFDHIVTQRIAHTQGLQFVCVQLAGARMLRNFFVHQRLCQRWSVLFVMPQFAKANDVNNNILVKLHAKFERKLGCQYNGFRIVAVHVQHRRLNHLHNV